MLTTVLQAIGLFAATNIDDIIVLSLFFARGAGRSGTTARILAGQYLGFAGILVAAKAGCRWQQSPAGARSHGALATSITGMVALVVSCVLVATHPSADLIFI